MLKEKVAFLGLGQCGSNISTAFEGLGYNNLVINSSAQDLKATNAKHKIKLNADGCSKDRNKAKRLMLDSVDTIVEEICNYITEEIIFVCFSAGGGTGSGISSFIISALTEIGKLCIPVTVIPNEKEESIKTCDNTFKCLSELEQLDGTGAMFILDNATRDKKSQVNSDFVNIIDAFLTTDCSSKNGNFDSDEKETILRTSGVSIMSKVSKDKTTAVNLIESLSDGVFAPYERDKVIMYLGVMLSRTDIDIKDFKKEVGEPYDTFCGYGTPYSMMVSSGMSIPITRINQIKDRVIDNRETIVKTMTALNTTLLGNDDLLGDIMVPKKKSTLDKTRKTSPRDLLMRQLGGE